MRKVKNLVSNIRANYYKHMWKWKKEDCEKYEGKETNEI